jgi:hypothetical protein
MQTEQTISGIAFLKNSLRKSLHVAAAAACLWPALAQAQTWNPTASDANSNTAAGTDALPGHLGGGDHNTAVGAEALNANTDGRQNTAVGVAALQQNTSGVNNTALGEQALQSTTTGGANTACGAFALVDNTTGNNNTAVGSVALFENTSGSNNVAVGYNALTDLAAGSSNIALGANAGKNLTSGSRNIYIGNGGTTGENNVIRIGQVQTRTFIAGIKGVPLSGATVVVRPSGQLGVIASSARYKTEIHDLADSSDRLAQLHPVSYQYKTEPGVTHFGLIAEEVDRVMPELVVRDEQNRPETVQYHEIIPLLLKERQEQRAELARQRAQIEQQGRAASRDHAIIEQLIAKIDELSRAQLAAK